MKATITGLVGTLLQALCLLAFILISRSTVATIGKPTVLVVAAVCMSVFLWFSVKHTKGLLPILLLPVLLTLGYIAAFYLVGAVGFPGLLTGLSASNDYMGSAFRVASAVFLIYAVGTLVFYALNKWFHMPDKP